MVMVPLHRNRNTKTHYENGPDCGAPPATLSSFKTVPGALAGWFPIPNTKFSSPEAGLSFLHMLLPI